MNLYIIDAFTSEPFKGNPAAVCLLKERKDDQWMQNVAKEMNLSETAFLYPLEDGLLRLQRWSCADMQPSPVPITCGRQG
jgi:PhzF family phenazine biosynthesis protein